MIINNKRSNNSTTEKDEPRLKQSYNNDTKGSLDDVFGKDIRPYIDIIDSMRKYGLEQDVDLPKVVVVGDQSSGKSSIIEIISGIQLPRGTGIVTRCPLELQLKKVNNSPWHAIITYKIDGKREIKKNISLPSDVEAFISVAQNVICKTKKGVSKELITLRVESPDKNAPDLTLIDLPGIARTAIEDQPLDICDEIKNIIMNYVKNENTVILCVISGDLDIAVNESVNIARKVDPNGLRTIGVITKPDIADIDHKHEIIKMLENKKINLKKGFNLVKCRSLEQLKNKLSLSDFLKNEMNFYKNDEIYKKAKDSQVGALNLARKITVELVNVIKMTLPTLRSNISKLLSDSKEELSKFPQNIPQDDKDKRTYAMHIGTNLNEKVNNFLRHGKVIGKMNFHNTWRRHFNEFQRILQTKLEDAFGLIFDTASLQTEIHNNRGKEISGFLSYDLFEKLIKEHVQTYRTPANCVQREMAKVVKSTLTDIFEDGLSFLPDIRKDAQKILNSVFDQNMKIAEERIEFIFCQESVVFTMDAEFDKIWQENEKEVKTNISGSIFTFSETSEACSTTAANAKRMSQHIRSYLKIVHTRLADSVPTALMQCLLFEMNDQLKSRIMEYISGDDIIHKVNECPTIFEDRKILMDQIERLKKGKMELDSI